MKISVPLFLILLPLVFQPQPSAASDQLIAELGKINNTLSSMLKQSLKLSIWQERVRAQSEKVSAILDAIEVTDDEIAKLEIDKSKASYLIDATNEKVDKASTVEEKNGFEQEIRQYKADIIGIDKNVELLNFKKQRLERQKAEEKQILTQHELALSNFENVVTK